MFEKVDKFNLGATIKENNKPRTKNGKSFLCVTEFFKSKFNSKMKELRLSMVMIIKTNRKN